MELMDYMYDRFIVSRPVILLRPIGDIMGDFFLDIFLILTTFLFWFLTIYFAVFCYRKAVRIGFLDKETQTQKVKWDKGTQTYNYYKPSIKHTLTRRLIVLEETLSPD